MNEQQNTGLDTFKYNVTKISLLLANIIAFVFFILRILNIIPRDTVATLNTSGLVLFLFSMYICLIKCKEKIFLIQIITYFILISFIGLQTVIAKYHIFLPIWIDFTILTAYIATNRKTALIISIYGFLVLFTLKISSYYNIDIFSFITLLMSLIAFSILGYLISVQLDKYAKENLLQSKKLEKLALIDELTGIFNRRAFFKIGEKILKQAKRNKKNISFIMMDLDYFKQVNDTYGHKAGDIVLKSFVNNIKSVIRENDIFARIGGEEFMLLLCDISSKDAEKLTNKILNKIRNTKIKLDDKKEINITVSLGIFTINNSYENSEDIQSALINADKALYVAKKTGRDKAVFY